MKVKNRMINSELRDRGELMRLVMPLFTEPMFHCAQLGTRLLLKGRWLSNISNYESRHILRPDGSKMRIVIITSSDKSTEKLPGILWMHGGGYVSGKPEQDVHYIDNFINCRQCVVVSPDYRLSFEAPFPAAIDDCYLALVWMKEHADELGIRDDQLMVSGNSAGGGITAALSIYARKTKEVSIAFQMPLYPMLDDRMKTKSMIDNNAPVWNYKANKLAWQLYLKNLYGTDQVPSIAAPSRETDYRGLPPTYTFIGSIDPFCDETLIYIENLKKAGVIAKCDVYKGCYHAFDYLGKSKIGQEATDNLLKAYSYAVDNYFCKQPK